MIVLDKCSKVYSKDKEGIKDVDLKLPTTGLIGILGSSGSGKSTLINCLGGLDEFTSGHLYLDDVEVKNLKEYSTYVFQEFKLLEELNVSENIMFSIDKENSSVDIDDLLGKLGIMDIKYSKVNAISGGQRQRVALARALVKDVPIILCDEPTASLDSKSSKAIFDLLRTISQDKLVIVVSHQEMIKEYTSQILEIEDGKIIESFNVSEQELSNLSPVAETVLLNKSALKLSFFNIRKNKVKAAMTFLFMLISLTALSLVLTILSINLDKFSYKAYIDNEIDSVKFYRDDDADDLPGNKSISFDTLKKINPDMVIYDEINFRLRYQNKLDYVNTVLVVQSNKYENITLNKNEVIISRNFASRIADDINSLISQSLNNAEGNLLIKGFLDDSYNNTIVMTNETLELFGSNLLEKSRLFVNNLDNSYSFYRVHNPHLVVQEDDPLLEGKLPLTENEACLPLSVLNAIYPLVNASTLIGKSVSLDMVQFADFFSQKKVIKEEFILTGYTKSTFVFPDASLASYVSRYGSERITAGNCGAIFSEFNLDTFKMASDNSLVHAGSLSDKIYNVYGTLMDLTGILIALTIVFAVISLFTVLNSISTSLLKSKKDLAVLICFKIKQKSLGKIFIFENMLINIFSIIGSIISYILLISVLNIMIEKEWKLNTMLLNFNLLIVLSLIVMSILIVLLAIVVPLKRIMRKRPIDILYER